MVVIKSVKVRNVLDSEKHTTNDKGNHKIGSKKNHIENLWSDRQRAHIRLGISSKIIRQTEIQ